MDDDFEELGPCGARGDGDLIIADRDVERLFGGEAQSVGGLNEWGGRDGLGGWVLSLIHISEPTRQRLGGWFCGLVHRRVQWVHRRVGWIHRRVQWIHRVHRRIQWVHRRIHRRVHRRIHRVHRRIQRIH